MQRIIIPIIIFFISWKVEAQSVVTGRVWSAEHVPIEGVRIGCPGSEGGTFTDSTGYFSFEMSLPGILDISHMNFRRRIITVEKVVVLDIVLQPYVYNIDEVQITGDWEGGVVYTSEKQIERIPALLGEKDIVKYMATLPGVVTTDALDPGIYVRGGNSIDNVFLVNDIEIGNPTHMTGILSTFDPWILGRSILYKSGFPAKYNNYLSAYVNMFPETVGEKKHQQEVTLGLLSSALKIRGALGKGKTTYALALRSSYLQYVAKLYNRVNNDGGMPAYSFYDVTGAVKSQVSERLTLDVFGLFTADHLILEKNVIRDERLKWNTFSVNSRLRYQLADANLNWKIGIHSGNSRADLRKGIHVEGGNNNDAFVTAVEYQRNFAEKYNWSSGLKYEHNGFTYTGLEKWKVKDAAYDLYTVYTSLNYLWRMNWKMEGGINYQYYVGESRSGNWSPRLKVNWNKKKWNVWVDFATTVQYNSRLSLMNVRSPADVWCTLNKELQPALCYQYSCGVDKRWQNGFYAYMALFWKDMRHLKDYSSVSLADYTDFNHRQIEGKGVAKGIEWDLIYNRNRLYFRMNYTLSDSWRRFEKINGGRKFYPPYDIRHHVFTSVSWRVNEKITLNAMWTYTTGMRTTFPVGVAVAQNINTIEGTPDFVPVYRERYNFKLPDNHRLDLNVDYLHKYDKWNLLWSVGIYNVYNQQNASFVYFKPEATDKYYTRFIPYSRVLLPFVPYISVKFNW